MTCRPMSAARSRSSARDSSTASPRNWRINSSPTSQPRRRRAPRQQRPAPPDFRAKLGLTSSEALGQVESSASSPLGGGEKLIRRLMRLSEQEKPREADL